MDKISYIHTNISEPIFLTSEFKSIIKIWDINKGLIKTFNTDFDFGGDRQSISNLGDYLLVGSYNKNTITLYDTTTNNIVWQRKNLRKINTTLILNQYESRAFINADNKYTGYLINLKTGETIDKLPSSLYLYENMHNTIDIIEQGDKLILFYDRIKNEIVKSIPKQTFAVLDCCFLKRHALISYSSGPLELIDTEKFQIIWRCNVEGHCLNIAYNEEIGCFLGIRWNYISGGSYFLSFINSNNGKIENEIDLGILRQAKFLDSGKFLITDKGQLISTRDGQIVKEFQF
jgi:WD40 repeat protein